MRKFKYLFYCLLASFSLWGQSIDKPHVYPVRPGTEAWKTYKYPELRKLLQIPEPVIINLNTNNLLKAVLRYPLISDLLVFNSFKLGFESLKTNFTAFDSLLNRKDLEEIVLETYTNYSVSGISHLKDPTAIGAYRLGLVLLEFIIADSTFMDKLEPFQKNELIVTLLKKAGEKQSLIEIYGDISVSTTIWPLYKLTIQETPEKEWRRNFLYYGHQLWDDAKADILFEIQKNIKHSL